jgi:hypothetical protein
MFIVQRYGMMPAAAGGVLHRERWSLTGIVGVGGQRSRRSGRQSPRPIRSVKDAAPGVAALPAHGLDREQHLLTIRTPRTTSSEIAVALWSSRTSTTVPSRISRTTGSSASERAFQASRSAFTLRQTRLTVSLLTAPPNSAFKARRTGAVGDDTEAGGRVRLDWPPTRVRRTGSARSVHGNTVGALTRRGAGAWKYWSAVVRGSCKTGEQSLIAISWRTPRQSGSASACVHSPARTDHRRSLKHAFALASLRRCESRNAPSPCRCHADYFILHGAI